MTLFLLPNLLSHEADLETQLPAGLHTIVSQLNGLIVENEKEGRLYLKRFGRRDVPLALLNEHTAPRELDGLLEPVVKGEIWGVISDAGLPCLADPGAALVRRARELGIPLKALPGPSSIPLGLLLSGLEAQRFAFHGYLPREEEQRRAQLKTLEKRSKQEKATQLFIEAPYRNQALLSSALAVLDPKTQLAVAVDLTAPTEQVFCKTVQQWKKSPLPSLDKRPALFLLFFEGI